MTPHGRATTSPDLRSGGPASVGASEAVPDLAYMGRQLTLCCLPRTNPGDKSQYLRQNGPYQLGMSAGPGYKLPYGSLPRLVLVWVCSEATQTQSRILTLGNSFLDFMHQIGITSNSGGKRSYRARLQDQMERLFNSTVQMSYRDDQARGNGGIAGCRPHTVLVGPQASQRAGAMAEHNRVEREVL